MTPTPDPTDDPALEQALRASRALEDAPPWLIAKAIALMPAAASAAGTAPATLGQALRRLLGRLVSDSGPVPALALGLRSGAAGVRQLLYSTEGRDIDLRVAPATDGTAGWWLSGQVLGPDLHGEVCLVGTGAEAGTPWRVALDELSEFRFGPVPDGRWQLTLRTSDTEIELPAFDLPGTRP